MRLPNNMRPIVCIAGPTASGKSELAVKLAKRLNGEIINADSMQVYRDLHILSARPSLSEQAGIAHHLFGHVEASQRYSTGQWVVEAEDCILMCLARGKIPILVGGTGLYYKALLEGLAHIPEPTQAAKRQAKTALEAGIDVLRALAQSIDPLATERVLGQDRQRLLRIVEVGLGTEKCLSEWQTHTQANIPPGFWHGFTVLPNRVELYARINARFLKMIEAGALEEVEALQTKSLPESLPAMKAIGVPALMTYLRGETSFEAAISLSQRDSRRYAKRQMTWIRGNMSDWIQIDLAQGLEEMCEQVQTSLSGD